MRRLFPMLFTTLVVLLSIRLLLTVQHSVPIRSKLAGMAQAFQSACSESVEKSQVIP